MVEKNKERKQIMYQCFNLNNGNGIGINTKEDDGVVRLLFINNERKEQIRTPVKLTAEAASGLFELLLEHHVLPMETKEKPGEGGVKS